jgi:hypothetical protein
LDIHRHSPALTVSDSIHWFRTANNVIQPTRVSSQKIKMREHSEWNSPGRTSTVGGQTVERARSLNISLSICKRFPIRFGDLL